MGWKNIKDRFEIKHIVQIRSNRICIGSGYIGEIISISFDGKIIKSYDLNSYSNDELLRYQKEINISEKTGELKELINSPDMFENIKPIYTCKKGKVIKKFCEEYEYPNVCTDGELIYENTFFINRKDAVKYCENDAKIGLKFSAENFGRKFIELNEGMIKATKRLVVDFYEFIISFFN